MTIRKKNIVFDSSNSKPFVEYKSPLIEKLYPTLFNGFTSDAGVGNIENSAPMLGASETSSQGKNDPPLFLNQTHSNDIVLFGGGQGSATVAMLSRSNGSGSQEEVAEGPTPSCDGAVIERGDPMWVAIQTADCVPIVAVNPEIQSVAILHAGWRGSAGGILNNLLEHWGKAGKLHSVVLSFGPSIRSCCYEVGEECLSQFRASDLDGAVRRTGSSSYLELTRVLGLQAERWGIPTEQIETLPFCTYCYQPDSAQPRFASHRRSSHEGSLPAGRNITYIGLGAK